MKNNPKKIEKILTKNNLNKYFSILEEHKLLNLDILKKMSESDYEKIGITEIGDRKKLLALFNKEKSCLIPILILIGVIAGTLILLHVLGILSSIVTIVKWVGIAIIGFFILIFLTDY